MYLKKEITRFTKDVVSATFYLTDGTYIVGAATRTNRTVRFFGADLAYNVDLHTYGNDGLLIGKYSFMMPSYSTRKQLLKALTVRAERFADRYADALNRLHG